LRQRLRGNAGPYPLGHEIQTSSGWVRRPCQPIEASKPPSGADWVHEIKHDGYRLIVCRNWLTVRLYARNAYDWTARLPAIVSGAGSRPRT
jgi:ATP-dependent DNA ligase